MYALFLDTHDKNIIEVLYKDDDILDKNIRLSERNHSDFTIPMLEELLKRNDITVHDIKEFYICNGPGSFTGVRLGVTIAKTLAYTLNIPIKTINSLDCLALSSDSNNMKVPIIRDVKGVFLSIYDQNNKLIEGPCYKTNDEFEELKKEKEISDNYIIENTDYNYIAILEKLKTIHESKVHSVNPIYIKVIEALKND